MIVARSLLFNVAFVLNNAVWFILFLPSLLLPRRPYLAVVRAWARSNLLLHGVIVGVDVEVRGRHNIPAGGLLVASKHQSAWETLALVAYFPDFAFILKRELLSVPLFGWYLRKAGQIPVDRGRRSTVFAALDREAREAVSQGRQIVIFPEGTRRDPGAEPNYKFGVAHLYGALGVPCLPVAHDAGLLWPRRRFLKRPGTITIEFLEPIPPGLPRDEFFALLRDRIEGATAALLAQAGVGSPRPSTAALGGPRPAHDAETGVEPG